MRLSALYGYGLCECGCGQQTTISPHNNVRQGWIAGEPRRFVNGHQSRKPIRYSVDEITGCWVWEGRLWPDGYGVLHWQGRNRVAHRVFYEQLIGPVPEGLVLDHLCENRACVNPEHLEPVTQRVNLLRGKTVTAENEAKTHCKHGHEFTPENTHITPKGARFCRQCRRDDQARRRAISFYQSPMQAPTRGNAP
jgi:hypothetical protein